MYFDRVLRIYFKYGIYLDFLIVKNITCREVSTGMVSVLKIINEKMFSKILLYFQIIVFLVKSLDSYIPRNYLVSGTNVVVPRWLLTDTIGL